MHELYPALSACQAPGRPLLLTQLPAERIIKCRYPIDTYSRSWGAAVARENDVSPQVALLGLLWDQPRHGYDLYQVSSSELGRVWRVGLSQLYAQLKQLGEAGMVDTEVVPQANRPPRKVYHLTPEGREFFMDWLHQPTPYLRTMRVDLLMRLYFFRRLKLPGLDQLLAAQHGVCREQADRFGQLAADAEDDFRRLVLEFRRGQMEAVIPWLDRCRGLLRDSWPAEQP
jgi:PadR family transcriptional regulator, regulatory protein AphA